MTTHRNALRRCPFCREFMSDSSYHFWQVCTEIPRPPAVNHEAMRPDTTQPYPLDALWSRS